MAASSSVRHRRLWGLALVAWVAFIWGHSLVAGPESSAESGLFVSLVRPLFEAVGVTDTDTMSFVVRKCAHFTEYAILGLIVLKNVRLWWATLRRRASSLLLAAVAVPFVDESLQLLTPGRTGMLRDVGIDLSGLATGLAVAWLLHQIFRSR